VVASASSGLPKATRIDPADDLSDAAVRPDLDRERLRTIAGDR
jgi:hypothetical protein